MNKKVFFIPIVLSMLLSGCQKHVDFSHFVKSSEPDDNPSSEVTCNHVFVDHEAVQASCTQKGNIAYAQCSECGKYFNASHTEELTSADIFIDKLPHDLTHHDAVICETIEYWTCSMCGRNFDDPHGEHEVFDLDGHDSHDILNDNVKNYLDADTEEEQIEALGHNKPFNDQVRKTLSWEVGSGSSFTVEVSTEQDFKHLKSYQTNRKSIILPGTLIPGTRYYYRVKDSNGNIILNNRGFDVDGTYSVRTIAVDGVSNVRDAGGWTAKDGHKVLYGKIYRGGRLLNITEDGKETLLGELGVKTELDLRSSSQDGTRTFYDERFEYVNCGGLNQYTMLVPDYTSPEIDGRPGAHYSFDMTTPTTLKNIFNVLADPSQYPIYYHCNAGADRTGSLTYFINGLLGVSYEDLTKDFELTTFSSQGNRWRSGVEDGHFVTTGEMAGIYQANTDNYVAWGKLHELISTKYEQENGELCSAIEYYLKKYCEITDETIAAVRRNLLGEDVEFDEVSTEDPVDTTFTMQNGNWSLDAQVAYQTGTFHGSECTKFYTTGTTTDHYIFNSLFLICDPKYTKYHFEVYVPNTSPRWDAAHNSGCRFHIAVKRNDGSSTQHIQFSETFSSQTANAVPIVLDGWSSIDMDISEFTSTSQLTRYAIYLPYGTSTQPAEIYIRNCYVIEE